MLRKTKKELILETFLQEGFPELTEQAIEVINSRLADTYGQGARASAAYIAEILIAAAQKIHFQQELNIPDQIENYDENPLHSLNFDTLIEAEKSMLILDSCFHRFQLEGNQEGIFHCRGFAKRGKLRAKLIADNEKLPMEKRNVKQEIAFWFEIWLSTPEIFKDWLTLRKSAKDFQQQFGIEETM
jgi:hypothetical protein